MEQALEDPIERVQYQNMEVMDLANELERQAKTKRDVVVDSRTLKAIVTQRAYQEGTEVKSRNLVKLDVVFSEEETQSLELTGWAHRQLAEKCGIPLPYYKKMMSSEHAELLASNINEWIESRDRRLIRTMDGRVRAILSDKYQVMDNYDVLLIALKKFKEVGAKIHRCDISDTHMYIKAINPLNAVDVEEYRKSHDWRKRVEEEGHKWLDIKDPGADILQQGIVIKNSEVGAGRFTIEPYVLRLRCNNGLIGTTSFAKVHLGSGKEIGEILSDRTKALEDEALWSKVNDYIDATFNPEIFENWVRNGLTDKLGAEIAEPQEAINNVVGHFKLSEQAKKNILDEFIKGQDNSQWGLINAMTATARETGAYDTQIELEKVAGELSEMKVTDVNRILGQ